MSIFANGSVYFPIGGEQTQTLDESVIVKVKLYWPVAYVCLKRRTDESFMEGVCDVI